MLERISSFLVDKLINGQEMDNSDKEVCVYGVQTLIYSIASTVWLICLGFLFHEPICACIIIGVFSIIQTVGGGKHAKTRIACMFIMTVIICAGLFICRTNTPTVVYMLSSSIAMVYLLYRPLILHPNKEFLGTKMNTLIIRSRTITSFLFIILIIILRLLPQYVSAYSMGLSFSALSRLVAVIEQNEREC